MSKYFSIFGIIALMSILIVCCTKESTVVPVANLAIIPSNVILDVGTRDTLKAAYSPFDATNKSLLWSSTDNSVITVNDAGVITAVAPGSAEIKLTTSDRNLESTCGVLVTKWENYQPGLMIRSIFADAQGTIWCGTQNGIVFKYDGVSWSNYAFWNSYNDSKTVYAITADSYGNIWFGTGAGLSKYDGNTLTHYNYTNSNLPHTAITSIAIDEQNNKWLGTMTSGVIKYDGTNWTNYNTTNSGLPFNTINTVVIDKSGKKWIGTNSGGVSVFDNTNWTTYNPINSALITQWVTSIFIDDQNNRWLGSSGGVSLFNESKWTNYNPITFVEDITIDAEDNKWFCTTGRGLARYDGTNWIIFTTANSKLANNVVYSIAIDKKGRKWVGTNNGISVLQDVK